jgi:dTMP kinase
MRYNVDFDIELRKNPYKGLYIAVEGIDGSGKTTQITALKKYFIKHGKKVTITSEPQSNSVVGKIIRQVLSSQIKLPPAAFQYLYSADRVVNQENVVKPALESGTTVLSHRSFWSVIPYGVMDKGLDNYDEKNAQILAVAQGLLSMYHQFIAPDITFYLHVPVDVAMERLHEMDKEKEIYEKREKLERIFQGYEWQLNQFPKEFTIVDGTKTQEEVEKTIISHIMEFNK